MTHDLDDDVGLRGHRGHELGVVERADDGVDAELLELSRLLLATDKSRDIVLRVLVDELNDRSANKTCTRLAVSTCTRIEYKAVVATYQLRW